MGLSHCDVRASKLLKNVTKLNYFLFLLYRFIEKGELKYSEILFYWQHAVKVKSDVYIEFDIVCVSSKQSWQILSEVIAVFQKNMPLGGAVGPKLWLFPVI